MRRLKVFLFISALCCFVPAQAQRMFATDKYTDMCSYYGETITGDISAYDADPASENVVKNIMSVIGLRPNFELRAANVPNAAAVVLKGKRYILYNPDFMSKINSASGSSWASISILAHEIGHHLNGHTLDQVGSRPETELEADEFSGFVLRRMGASLADAQAAMGLIASLKGSHSHPPKAQRLSSIATGWTNAGGLMDNRAIAAKKSDVNIEKPAVVNKPQVLREPAVASRNVKKAPARTTRPRASANNTQSALDEKYIASVAYFNADPNGKYYITTGANFVQVENNKVYLIGRLAQSNKPGYSLMLSDKHYNYLYIATGGVIVNGAGKRVGHLKMR